MPEPPPVVLLHGWGQSAAAMQPLRRALAAYELEGIALDLPGFGSAPEPPEAWNVDAYADWVAEQLAARGIKGPLLVGHSFGGRVAVALAGRAYPLAGLVLVSAAGLPPRRTLARRWQMLRVRLRGIALSLLPNARREELREQYVQRYGSADYKAASPRMRGVMVRALAQDLSEAARRIAVPTLLLWGANDRDTPPEMGERYRQLIPGSVLVSIPGADHFAHQTHADALAHCIAEQFKRSPEPA